MPRQACTLCVSVNFHGTSLERQNFPHEKLYAKFGYGRYTGNVGHQRVRSLLRDRGLKATYFVPAYEAQAQPWAIEEIMADGHEIASHGFMMEDLGQAGEKEGELLGQAHEFLTRLTGKPPRGFRAPHGQMSACTLPILSRLGYFYDASFQDDFRPYALDGDGGTGMVEIPQNEMLIDATLYGLNHTHARVLKTWIEEFDAAWEEGGLLVLTLHPRSDYGSGRASRIGLVARFLDHVMTRENVGWQTCGEVAAAWRAGGNVGPGRP